MDNDINKRKELADLIFGDTKPVNYYEEKYPTRDLKDGAYVTRFAPSPTGFLHIGGVYTSLISKMMANKTGGIFFVRIEDTDQERKVENGVKNIIDGLELYNLEPEEGVIGEDKEVGNYGPYIQSQRKDIYQAYAKDLIIQGKAYPCFLTKEEIDKIREDQKKSKQKIGVYGKWAKYREMPVDMAIEKIKAGDDYIVRFKNDSNPSNKIVVKDMVKGKLELPTDIQDTVIIKKDGLPTYHFAHAIDDHLMGVNLVTRGDEWLPSLPLHIALFVALGFKVPKYAHIAPLMKNDEGKARKLSKRKDPEAKATYLVEEEGIPYEAVTEYLINIMNANFEMWRKQNPDKDITEFDFKMSKMGASGALFDKTKLIDVSKNYIARLDSKTLYEKALKWSQKNDRTLYELLENNREKSIKIFGIERDGRKKPRKDISKYSDILDLNIYMYDDMFKKEEKHYDAILNSGKKKEEISNILEIVEDYMTNYYDIKDDKNAWFDKVKDIAEKYGYAREVKEYKEKPESFNGHVGTISEYLRVVMTNRTMTPDLYEIMQILGKEEVTNRLDYFKKEVLKNI